MIDVGVGLWTMRSTAVRPDSAPAAYRRLQQDAVLAEALGFDSLWLAEHHFWYDGWCPSPLTAAAAVLGATQRLRAGTGVHLLPLWELATARTIVETLVGLAGPRLELGVGLGYRDAEYDGFGLARSRRGRLMDAALDELAADFEEAGTPVMVGGFSAAALRRAGSRGLGILLPYSMGVERLRLTIEQYREQADLAGQAPGRVGAMRFVWATDGSDSARARARATIETSIREYAGAWFPLGDRVGFEAPELLARQLQLAAENAVIGPGEEIAEHLAALEAIGVDVAVLQVTRDDVVVDHRANMEAIGAAVAGFRLGRSAGAVPDLDEEPPT